MQRARWIKWAVYFLITLLFIEAVKTVNSRFQYSASHLVAIVLMALQMLAVAGFIYYAIFSMIFRKKIRPKLFLPVMLVSLILVLSLLEALFSYWLRNPSRIPGGLARTYKYYYDYYYFRVMQFEDRFTSYDQGLLYTLRPGASEDFRNPEFETRVSVNSKGLRDGEKALVAPEIIFLGDSYTMGWGVDSSETFASIIGRETGRRVLNAGIPSYGTVREFRLLERLDLSALKCLVVQYCANDLEENESFVKNGYVQQLSSYSKFAASRRSYQLSRVYFPFRNFLLVGQIWLSRQFNNLIPGRTAPALVYENQLPAERHALAFLDVLSHFGKKFDGVKIIVTDIDIYQLRDKAFLETLDRSIKSRPPDERMGNVSIRNSTTGLTADDYFILDYHIRPEGHRKIASGLIDAIRKEGL